MDKTFLVRALEAVLFISTEPMPADRLLKLFESEGLSARELSDALDSLRFHYAGRGIEVAEVGGGYQMRTAPELGPYLVRLEMPKPAKLSQAALESLAIIAYRQPITRADVEEVRGVDCGAVVRSLLERGLVRVVGKKDVPGRPLLYGTTKRFLEVFGLSTLNDLPTLRQIEDLTGAAEGSEKMFETPENQLFLPLDTHGD